jgi:hypothetical protein
LKIGDSQTFDEQSDGIPPRSPRSAGLKIANRSHAHGAEFGERLLRQAGAAPVRAEQRTQLPFREVAAHDLSSNSAAQS